MKLTFPGWIWSSGSEFCSLTHIGNSKETFWNKVYETLVYSTDYKLAWHFTTVKHVASGSITSWQIDGEIVKTVTDCFGAPKSLQMVTAAMKLKDFNSLEGKLWPTQIAY